MLLVAYVWVGHLLLVRNSEKYQEILSAIKDWYEPARVKIFITYYKPYQMPVTTKILVPIQVGRAVAREPFMDGELSEEDVQFMRQRMIGDDTGENISAKNRTFDVLTAYYWVWKNYKKIGNPKYIGFLAHRKLLHFSMRNYLVLDVNKPDYGYDEKQLTDILKRHQVITSYWVPYYVQGEENIGISFYQNYKDFHHVEDIDFMISFIEKNYPEMVPSMNKVLYDVGRAYPVWNFWIMEKELAFDYFEKLFPLMFALEKERGKEIAQYDLKQRRVCGYLAERFFAIWLLYQQEVGRVTDPFYAPIFYL